MSAGMDPDQRQAMARMQQETTSRCFDPRGTDYRTFRLTEADATLLRAVSEGVGIRDGWLVPRKCDVGTSYRPIIAAWAVIGERHGFDPATATEHPEGGAQVLAKPPAKTGPTMRGGQ